MKTHRIILFIIFLLGTVVFETKAQNNNMPERNWSQWSEWNSFECAKKLFFRIRYYETSSKGLYNWQIEFRNDYYEDLYFNYGLEESYKTHKIYGAESVQPIKANSTYISDNHHYVWQTNTNKFNEVDVYIFYVCLGRSNWEQTYPNYYSECTVNKKSNTITGYFNFKWKYKLESECYVENKDYPNGKTDFIKADGEIVLNNIRFIDDCIIWEGNNYVRDDTLCKRNENYYVKENQFSIGNINTYDKIEIIIKSENCFTKRITYHMILPQSIYKCSHEYFYSREIVKEDSTSSNDAQIVVGLHSVNSNVSSDLNNEFIDERDGKRYKTIKIGNQEWMAENLNYSTGNSWCYDNSSGNCNKYGRLYDWETAKNVCPSGWHLPSKSEFESLLSYYGEEERIIYTCLMLNSNLGFNVLFAGFYDFDGISKYAYHGIGDYNIYWTSTPYNENKMWFLSISRNDENARMNGEFGNLNLGFSVRCIHD